MKKSYGKGFSDGLIIGILVTGVFSVIIINKNNK